MVRRMPRPAASCPMVVMWASRSQGESGWSGSSIWMMESVTMLLLAWFEAVDCNRGP